MTARSLNTETITMTLELSFSKIFWWLLNVFSLLCKKKYRYNCCWIVGLYATVNAKCFVSPSELWCVLNKECFTISEEERSKPLTLTIKLNVHSGLRSISNIMVGYCGSRQPNMKPPLRNAAKKRCWNREKRELYARDHHNISQKILAALSSLLLSTGALLFLIKNRSLTIEHLFPSDDDIQDMVRTIREEMVGDQP